MLRVKKGGRRKLVGGRRKLVITAISTIIVVFTILSLSHPTNE